MTFEEWYSDLFSLALKFKCEFLIPPIDQYPRDGWENDLTVKEELNDLISYSIDR